MIASEISRWILTVAVHEFSFSFGRIERGRFERGIEMRNYFEYG